MAGLMDFLGGGTQDPTQGIGLMGMLANPQTAGLLGMAGGLLSAAGPSRLPVTNGQALGAGLQNMQQGIGNAIQNQRSMLTMQALQSAMGGQPQQQSQSQGPMGAPVSGQANSGPMSGPSAGMGPYAGYGGSQGGSSDAGAPAQSGANIFGSTPQQLWQKGFALSLAGVPAGAEMMKMAAQYDPQLQYALPTDSQRDVAAAYGQGTPQAQQALQGIVNKNGSMTGRAGGYVIGPQGITWLPNVEQGGMPVIQNGVPTGAVTAQPGATGIASSMAAAKAGGKAQYQLQQVWDPTANNGAGGFVQQTTANVANAANGGNVPLGIQNNNFGNIRSADGNGFASYNTAQDGVNAADNLLSTYGSKYGINTINGIANRWSPAGDGNNNPTAKAAAMAAASGVPANAPINLADPATRARILPALFDTETPGWRNAVGAPAAQPQRGGPMASQPPLGATTATNTAQNAASKQMTDSYNGLASSDSSYQQSRGALTDMIALANQMGPLDSAISKMPEGTHNWDSLVTQYDKAHATFVSNQYNALSAGTDASKGTVNDMVPSSDKPLSAKVAGLNTQLNNLDYRHLETQLMTPTFNAGDKNGFTTLNAAYHNTVKPEMMPTITPILQMSGPQQQAAVQAAVKANPALRPAFETLFNGGMLK